VREVERLAEPDSATREVLEEKLAMAEKRLKELPEEERRLVAGYRKGLFADFMVREEMERIVSERSEAEKTKAETSRQLAQIDRTVSYKGQVGDLAKRLSIGLDAMDFAQRRELLRLLVDEVVWHRDDRVVIKTIIPLEEVQLHPQAEGVHGGGEGEASQGHGT
jgi:hypothetical protein